MVDLDVFIFGGDLDGEAALDRFGWAESLSADGKRLVVEAWHYDGDGVGRT